VCLVWIHHAYLWKGSSGWDWVPGRAWCHHHVWTDSLSSSSPLHGADLKCRNVSVLDQDCTVQQRAVRLAAHI